MSLGMTGIKAVEGRDGVIEFELPLIDWHADWIGRLIIRWPGLERSWYRWADRNLFEVQAIAQENLFSRAMPSWDTLSLEWNELAVLPTSWRANLRNWRGIYLIIDQADGMQYVGSAYGLKTSFSAGWNIRALAMEATPCSVGAIPQVFAFPFSNAHRRTYRMPMS